jgi:hypothetical protein
MADLSVFMDTIKGASTAELQEFKRIIEQKLKSSFRVGDKVSFVGRRGEVLTGKVTRINPKLVSVTLPSGFGWRVHPTLLTKV